MFDVRTIRVFIASPGDLAVERAAFKDVIDELNSGFGDGAGVKFEALGWEDVLATTGRRSQGVINRDIDRCDVFVLTRVAQLASSCVRSIRNLRVTPNPKTSVNCTISVHSEFPVPTAPSFCVFGPPAAACRRIS